MSKNTWPFKYPCIDKYPEGQGFVSNIQLLDLAQQQAQSLGQFTPLQTKRNYETLRAAFKVSAVWDPEVYPELKVAFLDGTRKQMDWVKKIVGEHIQPLVTRIKILWDQPVQESHIRISFALPNQAWSMLGNEALMIPKNQPTMNLGWLDNDIQFNSPDFKNTGQVVVHEWGHALGMIHEHQNPKENKIVWNKPVVYDELARTNNWTPAMVDNNMFKKYGDWNLCQEAKQMEGEERFVAEQNYCEGDLVNGSVYDPKSVMHYFFPKKWMLSGPDTIPVNTQLSEMDKKWIVKYYGDPLPEQPKKVEPEVVSKPETHEFLSDEQLDSLIFLMVVFILITASLSLLVYGLQQPRY